MGFRENLENNIKSTIKKVIKILTRPLRKFLIIGIAIAIVIISLVASYDALSEEFSKKISEHMQDNPVKYDVTDGSIIISDEEIEPLVKLMSDLGIDINKLKITKEDLKKIYAAEVVTTEVNRGVTEEEGKFYGRVYVKRAGNTAEDLTDMTYIKTLEELENKVEEYNNGNIGSEELLKYYTVDEQDQICFVNSINSQTDKDGIITKNAAIKKIAYKDKISQFSVPVEFLVDICYISQNPGFTMALVDKILNETKINIAILQTTNHIETKTTYRYQKETVSSTKYRYYDSEGNFQGEYKNNPVTDISDPITEESTESSTSISSQLKIASVESWFMNLKYTYTKVPTPISQEIPEDDESNIMEDEEKTNTFNYHFTGKEDYYDGSYSNIYEATNTRKINQTRRIDITGSTESYKEGPTPIQEDKTDDIVNMIKARYKVPGKFSKVSPIGNLESGSGIFFNMLKNGERTQSLEPLMRYILGKATGNDYGVTELDFSIYNVNNFSNFSGGILGNTAEEKVWYSLRNMGLSEYAVAGVMGNIYGESGFRPDAIEIGSGEGYGLCQWSYGRKNGLISYAESKGKEWTDINIQVQYLMAELTVGGGADGFATYNLLSNHGYTVNSWKNATNASDAAVAFCYIFERPGSDTSRLQVRKEAAERYYNEFKGKELAYPADSVSSGGYTFSHYLQRNYTHVYGTSTIAHAGCGPTSLAMVLTGLLGNPNITPITVVENLEAYYTNYTPYYLPGTGTIWGGMLNNNLLDQCYGVKATSVSTEQGIQAVENGKMALGGVDGHILAIVPVPEEYKGQGYRFYIMDSARGLDGPYRSAEEVKRKPRSGGIFNIRYVIEPN